MKTRQMDLQFPLAGLHRGVSFQKQPPYTTPFSENCRPFDRNGRARGSTRPGLRRNYASQLGGGNPVRMIKDLATVDSSGFQNVTDTFGSFGDVWAAPAWDSLPLPSLGDIYGDAAQVDYTEEAGAVRVAQDPAINTALSYTIEIFIQPYAGEHWGSYRIYGNMDNTTPNAKEDGFVAELIMTGTGGVISGSLTPYVAGVAGTPVAFSMAATGVAESGWFTVVVDGNDVVSYWLGTALHSAETVTPNGQRVGFGMNCTEQSGICIVSAFRSQYYTEATVSIPRSIMVVSAEGLLYYEQFAGDLTLISTNLKLGTDRPIQAVGYLQKLYIADTGPVIVSGADGVMSGADLDAASVPDWTALDFNIYDYTCVITNGTGATTDGTYEIAVIAVGDITLNPDPGDGNCAYSIQRHPKIYDPAANTLELYLATTGQVPLGAGLIDVYNGRITFAGEHIWYMSRQDDPLDFNYGADSDDVQRAVAGTNTEAGQVSDPITAMVSHLDDFLIFATAHSMWVIRGDPAYGGKLDNLSRVIGMVGADAYDYDLEGRLWFVSHDGVYTLPPQANGIPQPISKDRLPVEFQRIDPDNINTFVTHDGEWDGLHIFFIGKELSLGLYNWFFDIRTNSFWPVTLHDDVEPLSVGVYKTLKPFERSVLLGCRDGFVRRFDMAQFHDDGTQFTTDVVIGPFQMPRNSISDAIMQQLDAAFGNFELRLDWYLYVGQTAELAYGAATDGENGDYADTGQFLGSLNYTVRPRARGTWACLRLKSTYGAKWSVEQLTAVIGLAGRRRKL